MSTYILKFNIGGELMKVYIVKTLWRNDEDFGCNLKVFETEEKAKDYYSKELANLMTDYDIDETNKYLEIGKTGTTYCTGDWDYFNIYIDIEEVN